MTRRGALVLFTSFAAFAAAPAASSAQTFAIGPRMSFVRPDPAVAGAETERAAGGTVRVKVSTRAAIELAMDWHSTTSDTVRVRDYPMQGSLLLYPVRATLSPYVLGGVGWYSQRVEALTGAEVVAAETERRFGYHGGFGGEMKLGRRAAIFVDYRYTFIRFGDEASGDGGQNGAGGGIPGVGSLFDTFRMSHEGSMWTGGLVIGF